MKKIIGLDLGTKTLGIAISDKLHIAAYGYENFKFPFLDDETALNHLFNILEKEDVNEMCLGLPLHMSGESSPSSKRALEFRDKILARNPNLKVEMIDERLTTVIANKRLLEADLSRKKRKNVIDKMAAVVILESYLQRRKNHG